MAIAFVTAGTAVGSFGGSVTCSVSVTSGEMVRTDVYYTDGVAPNSVQADGNEIVVTGLLGTIISGGTAMSSFVWIADVTASINVVVTWAVGPGACAARASVYSGVDSGTPFDALSVTTAGANTTAADIGPVDSETGDLVLVGAITGDGPSSFTPDAGTTVDADNAATNATWCRMTSMSKTGAASVSLGGDYADANLGWRWIAANFNAAAGGGSAPPRGPLGKPFAGPLGGAI